MLAITDQLSLEDHEYEWTAMRAQGAGGQNVNKVSSAVHLRFNVVASSLPDALKERLLTGNDQRMTRDGVLVIKAQTFRSQERNLAAALERLAEIVRMASIVPKARRATRPSRAARAKRLDAKRITSETKANRSRISHE